MVQILNLNTYIHEKKKKETKTKPKQNKTKQKNILNTFYYVHRFSKKMRPSHNIYINRLGLGCFFFSIKMFVHFCKFVFVLFFFLYI